MLFPLSWICLSSSPQIITTTYNTGREFPIGVAGPQGADARDAEVILWLARASSAAVGQPTRFPASDVRPAGFWHQSIHSKHPHPQRTLVLFSFQVILFPHRMQSNLVLDSIGLYAVIPALFEPQVHRSCGCRQQQRCLRVGFSLALLPQWGPLWPAESFLLRHFQQLSYSRLTVLNWEQCSVPGGT